MSRFSFVQGLLLTSSLVPPPLKAWSPSAHLLPVLRLLPPGQRLPSAPRPPQVECWLFKPAPVPQSRGRLLTCLPLFHCFASSLKEA